MSANGTPTLHGFQQLHNHFIKVKEPQIPEEDWTYKTTGRCHEAVWHATVKFQGQIFTGTGSKKQTAKDEAALGALVEVMKVFPLPMSEPHY
ncbi:hypothetical protein BOTBODRAFT_55344 [Botryobasidium botryosum FD-172 SS1]|uniref:DRBM domain-containing protein n=1 Tax=Botryobasidium botryosum (strain FD-172 SS1) TaxID=930990 RepID=A0A067MIE8_BOTB1|nr:hypothetical protein BOTBODRAFT_55344 [Botryobasidium botryosum FD-172 SS1]